MVMNFHKLQCVNKVFSQPNRALIKIQICCLYMKCSAFFIDNYEYMAD